MYRRNNRNKKRGTMKKKIIVTTLIVLVLAFTIGAAGAQPAQAATATKISAGWMPFAGSLYDPQTNSHASLNGLVHIVTHWKSLSSGGSQLDLQVNLAADHVTVTTDTGIPYTASGAGQSSVSYPVDPVYPVDPIRVIVPSFRLVLDRLVPPNPVVPPNPIQPFGLQFDLVFDAAGVLDLDASTVQVVELRTEE
jgi:hypothetical protein